MVDVAIIIVNYKTHKLVMDCIQSIIKFSESFTYEIIIIDNSEDKNEISWLEKNCNQNIKVINSGGNIGFGRANNLGVKHCNAKYVYFLNSDTILLNNAIFELVNVLRNDINCGVVGSNLYTEKNEPTHSFSNDLFSIKQIKKEFSILKCMIKKFFKKRDDFNHSNALLQVKGSVVGASLMMRKEEFELLNGFDERIFMYAEESLLCRQVQLKLGKNIYNVPTSKIIHLEGASDNLVYSNFKINNFIYGNYIYYKTIYNEKYASKAINTFKKVFYKRYIINKILKRDVQMKNAKGFVDVINSNSWKK